MRLPSTLAIPFIAALAQLTAASLHNADVVLVPRNSDYYWSTLWATSMWPTPIGFYSFIDTIPPVFNSSGTLFQNSTLRQTFTMTQPASKIRLRLSNVHSSTALNMTAVTVAIPMPNTSGSSAIDASTLVQVSFGGKSRVVVPAGAEFLSDPIDLPVASRSELSVSAYLANGQQGPSQTFHATNLLSWATRGDATRLSNISGDEALAFATWRFFAAVEGWVPSTTSAVVLLGDSITDGVNPGLAPGANWPGRLLHRMQNDNSTKDIAVINAGIAGNQVSQTALGTALMSRIAIDVDNRPGIKYAALLEGINDIQLAENSTEAQETVYDLLIQNYKQLCSRFHSRGIPLFGATITPFKYRSLRNGTAPNFYTPIKGVTRDRVNEWIRGDDSCFDRVIDFDAVLRNATDPEYMQDQYDSGDALHPNSAGYEAMANAFDLGLFSQYAEGVDKLS